MKSIALSCVVVVTLGMFTAEATAADTLMSKLKEAQWDGVIGTWVDEATGGENNTTVYAWKIKDRVIVVHTKDPNNETVALMGVNAQNGQIFHMGADKQGASSLGEWKIDADGSAVLSLVYTSADGTQGTAQIRQKMIGKDKMQVTIQLEQPLRFTLVRKK